MTELLRHAAHNTKEILDYAAQACAHLAGDDARSNAAGILIDPALYLANLKAAKRAIEQAIGAHLVTSWPSEEDYHAL